MGNTSCNDAILAYALCILILFGLRQPYYNEEQDPDPDPYKKMKTSDSDVYIYKLCVSAELPQA